MKWTPYAPTLPGFYWVKCVGLTSGKEYLQVAKVYYSNKENEDKHLVTIYLEGENFSTNSANITQYSNLPIPIPFSEKL